VLGDEEPLLLPARYLADRAVRVAGSADETQHLADPGVLRPAAPAQPGEERQRNSPSVAVEPQPDDVDAADAQPGVEAAALRQVTQLLVGLSGRPARAGGLAGGVGDQ